MEYDLEIDKVVEEIKKGSFEKVLLQFPDGLKRYASSVCSQIESQVDCSLFIWAGSCFGACDIPQVDFDLLVQFGHDELKGGYFNN